MHKTLENSSQVEEMDYNEQTNVLLVTYKPKGLQYKYHNIPQDVADGLFAAESVGKYLNQNVKGKFSYEKA